MTRHAHLASCRLGDDQPVISALASMLSPAVPDGGEPPAEVVVLPAGPRIDARDGRWWTLGDAEAVADASNGMLGGQEMAVDYEHQSLTAPANGQPAPAAGWISRFFAADGAVRAAVRWTPRAREMLRAGEYRYLSPVFRHAPDGDRRVSAIVGMALTNTPALPDIPAVARRRLDQEEEPMTLEELLARIGLGKDADAAAVDAALAKCRAEALAPVAAAAGLPEDAAAADVAKAVSALRAAPADPADPDPAKWAPRAELDRVSKRLDEVERGQATAAATAAVDAAVEAGKLAPSSRPWALSYATRDPQGFADFVGTVPVALAPGQLPQPDADGKRALTAAEQAVCRATGVSEADYLAQVAA